MPFSQSGGGGGGGATVLFRSLLTGNAASIDSGANGIPVTSTHLLVVVKARTDQAVAMSSALIRFNNDSGANYDLITVSWTGAAVAFASGYAGTSFAIDATGSTADANRFGIASATVLDYTDTQSFKHIATQRGALATAADANARLGNQNWVYRSTTAISRVSVVPGGGTNLVAGSSLTVYGLQ